MTDLTLWNPLKVIPSFEHTASGSREEVEALFHSFETMNLPILCQRDDTGKHVGYLSANGRLVRLAEDTGLMVSPMRSDSTLSYDYGYIYRRPETALSWLLCSLGFAPNMTAFEAEVLVFHIPENQRPLRLSFELPLNDAQFYVYSNLSAEGTEVERLRQPFSGVLLNLNGSN